MTKPISDKAEVAIEYPDKLYIGTFERSSRFDAHLDKAGISLTLSRTGDAETRKSVRLHINYGLFADILHDLADTASAMPPDDIEHREALQVAAQALSRSLDGQRTELKEPVGKEGAPKRSRGRGKDVSDLTPDEEVLLLHVLE
jgi:hypothetical protein